MSSAEPRTALSGAEIQAPDAWWRFCGIILCVDTGSFIQKIMMPELGTVECSMLTFCKFHSLNYALLSSIQLLFSNF